MAISSVPFPITMVTAAVEQKQVEPDQPKAGETFRVRQLLSPLLHLEAHLEAVINWSLFFFIYFCLPVDRHVVFSRSSSGRRGSLIKTPEDD